jgi:hypothetical protein
MKNPNGDCADDDASGLLKLRCANISILACVVAAAPASAGTIHYAKLVAAETAFENLPAAQRDKIVLRVVVTHEDSADHRPIHLWVEDGGVKTTIPLTGSGAIDMALRADWIARAVLVQTDQPQGSLQGGVDIGIAVPGAGPIPVAYLRDAVRQAQFVLDAGTRQAAGFLAMFVTPKVRGVKLTVSPCCAQVAMLTGAAGHEDLRQDSAGQFSVGDAALAAYDGGSFATAAKVTVIDPWIP